MAPGPRLVLGQAVVAEDGVLVLAAGVVEVLAALHLHPAPGRRRGSHALGRAHLAVAFFSCFSFFYSYRCAVSACQCRRSHARAGATARAPGSGARRTSAWRRARTPPARARPKSAPGDRACRQGRHCTSCAARNATVPLLAKRVIIQNMCMGNYQGLHRGRTRPRIFSGPPMSTLTAASYQKMSGRTISCTRMPATASMAHRQCTRSDCGQKHTG